MHADHPSSGSLVLEKTLIAPHCADTLASAELWTHWSRENRNIRGCAPNGGALISSTSCLSFPRPEKRSPYASWSSWLSVEFFVLSLSLLSPGLRSSCRLSKASRWR